MGIKKAVIPVAGLGTRLLPFTKAVPKELLPIYGKASIQFIIEEAVSSGIKEVLFVTSKGKEAIMDYFSRNIGLENQLKKSKKTELLKELKEVPCNFRKKTIIQKRPRGLGDAILHAEKFVGKEDFAVFLPDDIIFSKTPAIREMIKIAERFKGPVVAVERVEKEMVSSYGIINPREKTKRVYEVLDVVEKPQRREAFSNLGIVGRYIFPPLIFDYLKKTKPDKKGEVQLTDALDLLMKNERLYAYEFKGDRCDTGNKEGYLLAQLKYASFSGKDGKKTGNKIKKIFGI